ncbi:hypothetical protein [Streptomyces sp. GQFP]|uniref:hypothetical protein n=1 Tax=Streptomyces sp. GQFP TaxID=2907545 RepID=UPI001F3C6A68|nr:hypothetical protein [Streptomyces sp. GQFP]UIX34116.1 hypothetical protein LUX31_31230 [Streptomyces sp. GQFP]
MASRAVQVLGLGRTTALAVLAGAVVVIVGAGVLTRTRAARNTGDEDRERPRCDTAGRSQGMDT